MNTIKKRWQKWFAIPLVLLLALAIVLPWQLSRAPEPAYAGNVAASNISLTNQTTGSHTFVQFDIGWENSWRDVVNWDAAWVFVKYQVGASDWNHAALSTTSGDHTAPTGSTIDAVADGTGVFIYRNAVGTGTVSFTGAQLRWNYYGQGVADDALVTVKVFAIEMVYIPQGAFWVGDYDNDIDNCFYEGGTDLPYQVTSEGEITVADTAGNLYYDNDAGTGGDRGSPIPAAFPKGYDAFYMMKHEVSQRQYAEFLNTLTTTQAAARFMTETTERQYIEVQGGVYGCDASGNDVLNESDDGEWLAATWMKYADGAAYADWAGLRPMTELEFEKAARGTAAVVDEEYAWGTANITRASSVSNPKTATEVATPAASNCVYANIGGSPEGPFRCGALSDADDTREEAGASYYGVMELSGNLWEKVVVTVGHSTGRAFSGLHGDGALDSAGDADVSAWPATNGDGAGGRGASWSTTIASISQLRTADRKYAAATTPDRLKNNGFRSVRTAP